MTAVADLKLLDNNPRHITDEALERLAESIKRDPEFMRLRPIVVDADGVIIGGNQRYKAICRLGMHEIPDNWVARAADLTDDQRRRFVLVDNAPDGMAGGWDYELLTVDWDLPELEALGFDIAEIELESMEIPVIDGDGGKLSGDNYGDARGDRIPVNIMGIGGLVDRALMERVRDRLMETGATKDADNGEHISAMLWGYIHATVPVSQ